MWPSTIQGIGDLLRQGRLFSAQCELEQLQPLGNASEKNQEIFVGMPEIFVVFFLAFVSVKVGEGW